MFFGFFPSKTVGQVGASYNNQSKLCSFPFAPWAPQGRAVEGGRIVNTELPWSYCPEPQVSRKQYRDKGLNLSDGQSRLHAR